MVKGEKKYRTSNEALNEVKDRGILLYLASGYICETPILKKMGSGMEKDLEVIRKHINELKGKVLGKPSERVDVSEQLSWISNISSLLKKGDSATKDKCIDGKLGKEFNEKVISLIKGVRSLRDRVEGKSVSYSVTDSVLGVVDFFSLMGNAVIKVIKTILKIMGVLAAGALLIFLVLFFFMESERSLIKQIDKDKIYISNKEDELFKINEELRDIQKKVVGTRRAGASRRGGIERMDLNLKEYQLLEEKEKLEIDIDIKKRELDENTKKLETLKQKPLLERFLGKKLMEWILMIKERMNLSDTQAE